MHTVVLSIDAELGWGFHDQSDPPEERIESSRDGWRTLLRLLDEFDVPATWGVVGHLLLDDCQGVHESHPLGPNWFDHEREEWADRPDLRFGRDLVEATLRADAGHELGFQTFSHVELGHESVAPELARAECAAFFDALDAAEELGAASGESPSTVSVCFPRNQIGHRDVLAEWGFECYRGEPVHDRSDGIGAAARTLAQATVSAPPLVEPTVDDYGLVEVPPSLELFGLDDRTRDVFERLRTDPMELAARRGIDRAASEDGVFHLWLRANDLVDERDVRRVRRVLSHLDERRGDDLEVATLGEVARAVQPTLAADPPEARP